MVSLAVIPVLVADERERKMRADDQFLRNVLFIGVKHGGKFIPKGTGFFVAKNEAEFVFQHIVTARHVIEDVDGDNVWIRANKHDGGLYEEKMPKAEWRFHPEATKKNYVDVAVCPSSFPPQLFDYCMLRAGDDDLTDEVIADELIGIGDVVSFPGLYTNHYGAARNIPVLRQGIISSMRVEPCNTLSFGFIDGYLIEAHSIGGSSGSPVFVMIPPLRFVPNEGPRNTKKRFYLMGVLVGHWTMQNPEDAIIEEENGVTEHMNTGIGIVIPIQRVNEVLNDGDLVGLRKKIAESHRKELGDSGRPVSADP